MYEPQTDGPKVIQVIQSRITRGCGVTWCTEPHDHETIREVIQYHDLNGIWLAEYDTWPPERQQVAS